MRHARSEQRQRAIANAFKRPADQRAAPAPAHLIAIGVARSDEPDDAYFWRCSCGRTGPLTLYVRRARNGGQRHQAAMEKR